MANYKWIVGNMVPMLILNTYGTSTAHWHFDEHWPSGEKMSDAKESQKTPPLRLGGLTGDPVEDTSSEDLQVTRLVCSSHLLDNFYHLSSNHRSNNFISCCSKKSEAIGRPVFMPAPHAYVSMYPEFNLSPWKGKLPLSLRPTLSLEPTLSHTLEKVSSQFCSTPSKHPLS